MSVREIVRDLGEVGAEVSHSAQSCAGRSEHPLNLPGQGSGRRGVEVDEKGMAGRWVGESFGWFKQEG